MIKYIGSKRRLVPVLGAIASASQARTALDLFTGTTRVAQEFKRRGLVTTAVDLASYSEVLARCYISTDAASIEPGELADALAGLARLPGRRGYFTETFCEQARFVQPFNGERIDAIREAIEERYAGTTAYPILLTALLLAADRVDSTTGVQMAFLKNWSPRSYQHLELRMPELLPGPGITRRGDALALAAQLPAVDLAYLDPPYNQHRYFTNYHVWETLVRWDAPAHYGVVAKRLDARDPTTRSVFNTRSEMPAAFERLIREVRAGLLVVSYNDEAWVGAADITRWLRDAGHDTVVQLSFDSRRYVGAQIGVFNPSGHRVGEVGKLRNTEYLFIAGDADQVAACAAAATAAAAARR